MFEQDTINHHIQRRILSVLCYRKMARFRDLRPPRVDTNLFSYHLKVLIRHQLVQKVPGAIAWHHVVWRMSIELVQTICWFEPNLKS